MKWRLSIEQFWFSRSYFYVKSQRNPSIYFSFKNIKNFYDWQIWKTLMYFLSWNFLSSIQKQSKNQQSCGHSNLYTVLCILPYENSDKRNCLNRPNIKDTLVHHPKQRCANILKVPRAKSLFSEVKSQSGFK